MTRSQGDPTPVAPEAPSFEPIRVLEVELGQPLPAVPALDEATGRRYRRAMALARWHARPLGIVDLHLDEHGLSAEDYARQIWRALHAQINAHLREQGLPEATGLGVDGVAGVPADARVRERSFADAPFASVIVATRDRPESLATCLRHLLSLEYPRYEIIVVDNAPKTAATANLVRRRYGDLARVRYVREDRPGLAAAHNRGVRAAKGAIVAFTDDDVVVDARWLAELVGGFRAAENVGCVTGSILPVELETPAQVWIEQYGGFGKGFRRRIFDLAENRPRSPLYPFTAGMFGSGANMAFTVSALRASGGFDPALGAGSVALGGDDLAAFFGVITSGYRLVYEPAAIVHHLHRRDYAGLRRQVYGYGVGLTAYLTKALIDTPQLLAGFAAKVPYGLVYALSARSPKNAKKLGDYPEELTRLERRGMLYGPLAYLRGRRQSRDLRKQLGPRGIPATPSPSSARPTEEAPPL